VPKASLWEKSESPFPSAMDGRGKEQRVRIKDKRLDA